LLGRAIDPDGVAKRPAKTGEFDVHDVAIQELDAVAEAEGVRAEEVNVDIALAAMGRIFEVVMLKIGDGVRHIFLPGGERFGPDRLA
jgi:hypothetical protein